MNVHKLIKILRRLLMVVIVFMLPFAIYSGLVRRNQPPSELQPYEFVAVLTLTFIFSAIEGAFATEAGEGAVWGWIFGIVFTCGWVFGYGYFFGDSVWAAVFSIIVAGLLFGFICAIFGTIGESCKCWVIERKIKKLEEVIKGNESILESKFQIEKQMDEIIALDPANLNLHVTLFRKQAFTKEQLQKRIIEIDEEMRKTIQQRKLLEDKLNSLVGEKRELERNLESIQKALHEMELKDPANVAIKLPKLRSDWGSLSQRALESLKAAGKLEYLYKEQLLLGFKIKNIDNQINNQRKEVNFMQRTESKLQLEKLILQLEILERKIEKEKPYLLQIKTELKELEEMREKLKLK